MNKIKLILIILIAIILCGGLYLAGAYGVKTYMTKVANRTWEEAKNIKATTFHYNVSVEGKEGDTSKYTQTMIGDFKSTKERKGTYASDNYTIKVNKEFIIKDSIVYAKDTEGDKYFIWQVSDYPEAIYYNPFDLILATKTPTYLKKDKMNGQSYYIFQSSIKKSVKLSDYSASTMNLWVNIKTKQIDKVEFAGMQGKLNITKTITFTDYDKAVDIQVPKNEEIAK